MCIAILSTAHPDYPLIILSNRDEYLGRPTAEARWWPSPDDHILGGRDLHRPERGTWLGITKQGRLAILTNFREKTAVATGTGLRSRGAMVNAYLKTPKQNLETSESVAKQLVDEGLSGVGGFSLLFGRLKKPEWNQNDSKKSNIGNKWKGLCVLSNRSQNVDDLEWICADSGETHALSNSLYGEHSWPKVLDGEKLLVDAIKETQSASPVEDKEQKLISQLLKILSRDTLPQQQPEQEWEEYLTTLRQSIFIPAICKDPNESVEMPPISHGNSGATVPVSAVWDPAMSGKYGTQKQTIILVDWKGRVKYFERTLYDSSGKPISIGKGDVEFEFLIDGWDD